MRRLIALRLLENAERDRENNDYPDNANQLDMDPPDYSYSWSSLKHTA